MEIQDNTNKTILKSGSAELSSELQELNNFCYDNFLKIITVNNNSAIFEFTDTISWFGEVPENE